MGGMTRFQVARDACLKQDGENLGQLETRACTGCGADFQPKRSWQVQLQSAMQRAYVRRQSALVFNYYGA